MDDCTTLIGEVYRHMQQKTFIKKIGECLNREGKCIGLETQLYELEGWDPVGRLLISALLGQFFKKTVDQSVLVKCRTVGDIVELVKDDLES